MKIRVTQKHIKEGGRNGATSCPITLALESMGKENVHVCCLDIHFYGPSSIGFFRTPPRARTFIKRFDKGLPVKPFVFEI